MTKKKNVTNFKLVERIRKYMYGYPVKIQEICYEDDSIKQIFDNREVYMIYPDECIATGRVEKQEPLTESEFEELTKSINERSTKFFEKYGHKK